MGGVRRAARLAEVVNSHNVRVAELGQRARLTGEAFGEPGIIAGPGRENLQGHEAVEPRLTRLIDGAHAAFADELQHFELGEELGSWPRL